MLSKIYNMSINSPCLPPIVTKLLEYTKYVYDSRKKLIARNKALRNTYKQNRCFILATGPSIKLQNLKMLRDEYTIAVNNFFLHQDFKFIAPKFYCMTPYHPHVGEQIWQQWIDEFDQNISSMGTTLFFNAEDKERLFQKNRFINKDAFFVSFTDRGGYNKEYDLSKPMIPVASVSIMALYIALHLGFKEIYLLGCDHDWLSHLGTTKHFYSESESVLSQRGYSEWSLSSDIGIEFASLAALWDQYRQIRTYSTNHGIQIYYSTPNGILDLFPPRMLDDIFPNHLEN